jgi:tRNA-dihydrouridine synthase
MNDFPKKPRTLYDKTKEDAKKDFIEFLELYKKYEHRYSLSEIKDHALWLVRELKNSSLLKKKILNIDSEEEIIRLFKSI